VNYFDKSSKLDIAIFFFLVYNKFALRKSREKGRKKPMKNYYEILEVNPKASKEVI